MSALLIRDITAELGSFLENEAGSAFCVPWTYGEKAAAALTAAGFVHRQLKVTLFHFVVDALCITFRDAEANSRLDEALSIVYGAPRETARQNATSIASIGDRQFHPLVLPKEANVSVYEPLEKPKDLAMALLERAAITEYRMVLETLSRITGYWVHFHAESSGTRQPFPHEEGHLHIVTNSAPPGQVSCRYTQTSFGKLIHPKGLEVLAYGPTAGRGRALKDEDGLPTVQLLGNTWYLLLPTLGNFNAQTSRIIFERLMGQALSAHQEAAAEEAEEATPETFATLFTSWVDETPKALEGDIRKAEERIARLQEDLVAAHRALNDLRHFVSLCRNPSADRKTRKRAKTDWEAIRSHPLVKRVTFVDDGLHVETVPIQLQQDEYLYDLGSFTVRVGLRGQVSVWSESPKHYKGYAHPHMNDVGHPCYGNAGTAITQAAGEMRIADAVRYMLRWLTEGYTPALTEIKLETWPRVGESDEAYGKRMGLHQIVDPLLKERQMSDADAAVWKEAVEMVGTLMKDTKLDAILADPPGFTEASEQPQQPKQEESNDASA